MDSFDLPDNHRFIVERLTTYEGDIYWDGKKLVSEEFMQNQLLKMQDQLAEMQKTIDDLTKPKDPRVIKVPEDPMKKNRPILTPPDDPKPPTP